MTKNRKSIKLKKYLLSNEIYFKTIASVLLSIMAIVISIAQVSISIKQNKILKDNYFINIEPNIDATFQLDITTRTYSLVITNNGINRISNLKLRYSYGIFNTRDLEFNLKVTSQKDSLLCSFLDPGNQYVFNIKYTDFQRTIDLINATSTLKEAPLLPIQAYYLSFIRRPDKREYFKNKYLFLSMNPSRKSIFPSDPEEITGLYLKDMKSIVEKKDENAYQ